MQKETNVMNYKPHIKNLSQSLSPTYGINTENVHETYFSLPNSST